MLRKRREEHEEIDEHNQAAPAVTPQRSKLALFIIQRT